MAVHFEDAHRAVLHGEHPLEFLRCDRRARREWQARKAKLARFKTPERDLPSEGLANPDLVASKLDW